MKSLARSMYSPRLLDALFGLIAVATLYKLGFASSRAEAADAASADPVAHGIIAVSLVIVIALLTWWGSRLDRRCADDYVLQLMAQSAVIGIGTMMLVWIAWDALLGTWLGAPSADDMVSVALAGWSIGYFAGRLKGTVG